MNIRELWLVFLTVQIAGVCRMGDEFSVSFSSSNSDSSNDYI